MTATASDREESTGNRGIKSRSRWSDVTCCPPDNPAGLTCIPNYFRFRRRGGGRDFVWDNGLIWLESYFIWISFKVASRLLSVPLHIVVETLVDIFVLYLSPFKGVLGGQSSGNEIQLAVLRDWSSRRGRDKVEQHTYESEALTFIIIFFFLFEIFWLVISLSLSLLFPSWKCGSRGLSGTEWDAPSLFARLRFVWICLKVFSFNLKPFPTKRLQLLTLLLFTESCSRPSFFFFFSLFFPAVCCNLVVKLRNKTTSRKRPLLEARHNSSSWRNTRRERESFYLNMDMSFIFFFLGFIFFHGRRAELSLTWHTQRERESLLPTYIIHLYTSVCNCNMKGFYFLYRVSVGSCLFHERTTGPPLIFKPPPPLPPPTNEIFLLYPSIRFVCLSIRPPDRLSWPVYSSSLPAGCHFYLMTACLFIYLSIPVFPSIGKKNKFYEIIIFFFFSS